MVEYVYSTCELNLHDLLTFKKRRWSWVPIYTYNTPKQLVWALGFFQLRWSNAHILGFYVDAYLDTWILSRRIPKYLDSRLTHTSILGFWIDAYLNYLHKHLAVFKSHWPQTLCDMRRRLCMRTLRIKVSVKPTFFCQTLQWSRNTRGTKCTWQRS